MSSQEDRDKRRNRRQKVRSHIARSLEDKKFRQRVVEDRKKIDVSKLTHKELVELIQEKEDLDENN